MILYKSYANNQTSTQQQPKQRYNNPKPTTTATVKNKNINKVFSLFLKRYFHKFVYMFKQYIISVG